MDDNEAFYDAEIAPALLEIGRKLEARGMGMVATVEYAPGKRGGTYFLPPGSCLEMRMVHRCCQTAPNIDAYMIGLARYCAQEGIDTSSSVYMNPKRYGG